MPLRLLDLVGADLGLGGPAIEVSLSHLTDCQGRAMLRPIGQGSRHPADGTRFQPFRVGAVVGKPVGVLGVVDLSEQRLTAAGRLLEDDKPASGDVAVPDRRALGRRVIWAERG